MAQVRKASGRDRATETTRELPQAIARSSSAGSIRKSITKVPSEGLIVLPPDKEFVRFENGGDSSTNCVSVVRVGSAGRVERNLQMARKKELEDEISTDSASASGITTDGELQKRETKCKPLKQTDKLDAKVDRKEEEEESESSDSDSSDSDEPETSASAAATEAKEGAAQAPVELKGKFLKAVMDEDYENAKELCQKILLLEPDNKTCSEFHAVIVEKIKQEDEKSDDSEESTEESSDETEEDENQESSEDDQDDDDDNEEDDDEDNESSSDDDFALPPGPINLIMGGLPIRPQKR